jgi:16S rRNA (uracil1498-N3)-methyltransferase
VLRPRFFTGQALPEAAGSLTLESGPSRHIARTLRMGPGDVLCLFDGSGREARGEISAVDKAAVTVRFDAPAEVDRESALELTLAIAVSRGDRMDTVVQKSTELGVTRLWPLLSARTGVKLDPSRWEKKLRHWQQVAISACEQCGRNVVPEIAAPATLEDVLARSAGLQDGTLRCVLHPVADAAALPERCRSLLLLVGPEGGFSDEEIAAAAAAQYRCLQLGPRVLRTETAPLAALAIAQARWGDLGI